MNSRKILEKYHVRRYGRIGGPRVLLLHSLAADSGMWWPQIDAWRNDFEVITYDLPGHGRGPAPTTDRQGMDGLVDDLRDVVHAVANQPLSILGLSLGGMIAQRFAALEADSVAKLVLADTDFYTPPVNPWAQRIETVQRRGMEAVVETTLDRWFTAGFIAVHPVDCNRVRDMIRATSVAGYAHCAHSIAALDNRALLASIGAPTLVVVGAEDPSTPPARASELAAQIPGARYAEIGDAKHLPNIEQSEAFNDVVRAFLLD